MSRILSAVAWPYANGPRHIGHVAGFGVPSDVFSRYMRMAGHDVLMVSGTDEHGTPILVAADGAGMSARELADQNNRLIVEDLVALGLSYDLFTRTTAGNHYRVVQDMFATVRDNGYMIEQVTRAAISPSTGRTLPARYIEGTCPICGAEGARGDQCDNCGNQMDPTELINPHSRINGETPNFVESVHYFLDLPALADALSAWLDEREQSGTWRPNVIKFSQNFLEDIRPRAMTRDIDWGIPVPGWEDLGVLNLPTEVVSSEFLTMEGKKFSSSHGIVIYVRDFLSRYQADALRYFISAAGPETSDSDFTWAEFVRRTNGELVAGWGNLVNRTASMIAKKFGEIPAPGELQDIDRALLDAIEAGFETVGNLIRHHRQKAALSEAMRLVGEANKYVTDTAPFKLKAPEERERLATVLWTLAQAVADLNLMLSPFLPHAANDIDRVMGGSGEIAPMPRIEEVAELDPQVLPVDFEGRSGYPIITGDYTNVPTWERHAITVGTPIAKPTPVFVKLDEAIVEEELARYADAHPDDVTGA